MTINWTVDSNVTMLRFDSLFGCCQTGSASACIQLWATEAPHQRAQTLEHAQVATSACMEEFTSKIALYTVTEIGSQMCSIGVGSQINSKKCISRRGHHFCRSTLSFPLCKSQNNITDVLHQDTL